MTAPRCELTSQDGTGGITSNTISLKTEKVLGRHPDCDVCFDSGSVSGRHAKIRVRDGRIELFDMGSSYGTFVEQARVMGWTEFPEGANAWLGDIQIRARLLWSIAPTPIEVYAGGARSTFTVDMDADGLGARELSQFPMLAPLLPLEFERDCGAVSGVRDATGVSHPFVLGRLTLNGVVIALVDDVEALASVVAPRAQTAGDEGPSREFAVGVLKGSSIGAAALNGHATDLSQTSASTGREGRNSTSAEYKNTGVDWSLVAIGVLVLVALVAFAAWIL